VTPDEYRRAGSLFDRIRLLPEAERAAALDAACPEDCALRIWVTGMLAADRRLTGDSFLERGAVQDAARLVNDTSQLPAPGTVIRNYRLGAQIGAGGMGVVYEALDLRLDRRVAVKVLPLHTAAEKEERVQRFQREARAASLLNHPNMVAIYDAEFEQGWCYIAMEFVQGKTLRQAMQAEGRPLDAASILDLITQAAAALSAAHRADIVHRDIKPENIMLSDDGFVKLLDFGLAKLREAETGPSQLTRTGTLAGTVYYLSPEQVMGEQAGPGSDLFSLGVVAYELATGVRPFDGPTDGAVFNAILHSMPRLPSAVRPGLGADLDGLIMRLLEKDPELRFQTARDLRSSCLRLSRDHITLHTAKPAPKPWLPVALLLAVLAIVVLWLGRPLPAPRVLRVVQITRDGLPKEFFVNDGKRLYYASGKANTELKMYQVSTRGGDPVPMSLPAGLVPFDISTDGSALLLGQFSKEPGSLLTLWEAAALGGPLRRIADLQANDARWSPKGDEIVYCAITQLRIARADGSESRLVADVPGDEILYPDWSPDGRLLRFTLLRKNVSSLWEVWPDGTHLHQLFATGGDQRQEGDWTADGKYFLFSSNKDLWALPRRRSLSPWRQPAAVRLTEGPLQVDRPQPGPGGRRIFFRGRLDRGELVRYDQKAAAWVPYLHGLPAMQLNFSRDGKWITYTSYPDTSVWRCAADGTNRVQLTAPPLVARNPRWSPDGTQIAFYGNNLPGKPARLFVIPATGGAVRELSHGEAGPNGDEDGNWFPDGRKMVFGAQGGDHLAGSEQLLPLRILDLKTGRTTALPGSEGLWSARLSPDGRWVAALGFPQPGLWLYNLATNQRKKLNIVGASWPSWSPDSQYLYFADTSFHRVRISDGKLENIARLDGLKVADGTFGWVGIAPDGSLISTRDAGSTEIYALDWDTP
jgi:Tol biopolymer transport system component